MTTYGHDDLLRDLRIAVNRDYRRGRRRVRIALGASVVAVLVGGAAAAATNAPWWQNAAPPVNPKVVHWQLAPQRGSNFPPAADRSRARTVSETNGATLVAAPVSKSGYCMIPALPGHPDLGSSCEYQATDEVRDYALPASKGTARWIIYGRFTNPQAALVDLSDAVGQSLKVKLQPGGFFIADIPTSRWHALNGKAGAASVLDERGKTLSTVCLDFGPSPYSPQAGQGDFPSGLGAPPCKPSTTLVAKPELSKAKVLVQMTLVYRNGIQSAGTTLALWQAPNTGRGECLLSGPLSAGPSTRFGGYECGDGPSLNAASSSHPINVSFSSALSHGLYDHLVQGSVYPSSGIVKVELLTPSGLKPLAFANNWFLGELAPTKSLSAPNTYVVGYDQSGHEVARVPVSQH